MARIKREQMQSDNEFQIKQKQIMAEKEEVARKRKVLEV
jgi:hypothetical protein